MNKSIRALKLNLKEIANDIRNQKKIRKPSHPAHEKWRGQFSLLLLKQEYRHKHVAYCMARGRSLEQIDSAVRLDEERVTWILKTMEPDSKEKLYVVCDETLTPAQQAVQSAHAVAEFLRKYPNTMWSNGHLILLKTAPHSWLGKIVIPTYSVCDSAEFIEPDMGNKVTAFALFGKDIEECLRSYKLV